ncbi:MAG: phosphotransferase [Phycisphaeraceae bacterium]
MADSSHHSRVSHQSVADGSGRSAGVGISGTGSPENTGTASGGGGGGGKGDRDRFAVDELAITLSHYDLGTIEAVQEYPRGSRKAPKLILRTDKGLFMLKRRARGKDDPFKVAFCHSIQLHLANQQFPLPHLIGTRKDNNSMLQWKGGIYEVFEYIKGTGYDNSLEATQDSGKTLGLFHKLLKGFEPEYEPPRGSYHAARIVQSSMEQVPHTLEKIDPRTASQSVKVHETIAFLHQAYNEAAAAANATGLPDWPMQIIHSDWHPGNMLFRGSRVVAVIDYDAARLQQRVIDTANGSLQFSILGGGDDAAAWPEYIDLTRFKRFLIGYDSVNQLSKGELAAIPPLMTEALIAEAAIPIAATGAFARMDGFDFLLMIERKVRWLQQHAGELAHILD